MIKAALFDYGGVLSPGGRAGTLEKIISENTGVPVDEIEVSDLHDQLRRGLLCSDDFFDQLNARYPGEELLTRGRYIAAAEYVQRRADPVYELAEKMRKSGITTAIFSNVYRMSARELTRLGRYDDFGPILLSCYEGTAKPDQDFFDLAFERTGVAPEETLLIDDQAKNLEPARQLGMFVVQSVSPEQVVTEVIDLLRRENGLELQAA